MSTQLKDISVAVGTTQAVINEDGTVTYVVAQQTYENAESILQNITFQWRYICA